MTRFGRHLKLLALLVIAILVVACGGGSEATPTQSTGGGSGDTTPTEAASGTPASSEEPVRIAMFLASAANAYAQAQLEGAQQVAAEMNATVDSFDGQFDSQRQFTQLQDAIASGKYDAFVISPNDGNALLPVTQEAVEAGIVIGCILAPCGPSFETLEPQVEGQVVFAGIPFVENGAQIAELVVQACEGKDPCKVAYMPGAPELPLETARLQGFNSVIEQHPNIEVILTSAGGYLAETALPVAQDVLRANPDIAVFASSGDQMIDGVEQAVKDAGLEGQVALVGNGGTKSAVQAVREGRWFGTVAGYPRTEGIRATEYVIRAVRGENVEPRGFGSEDLGTGGGPLITQENAADFEAEWEG